MKILITGGSGFIGTNLTDYYVRKGWNVKNVDVKAPKQVEMTSIWTQCDITDKAALSGVVLGFEPDYIVHLAARTDLDGKSVDDYQANTTGVENVLQVSSQLKGLKKILITSSMLVCHTGYMPKDQYDYAPTTYYGESKVITEQLTWKNKPTCDWAILRPTSMWGPWFDVPYRNFFDIVGAGRYVHIGHRSCTKTYGYIENAVYQIDSILMNPTTDLKNKVFYLGDEPPIFIEEWANEIGRAMGRTVRRVPFWMIRMAAYVGDVLKLVGVRFPMTSFRLKNMTTDNICPLQNTYAIAPEPPVDRITAVGRTVEWMKAHG